MQTALPAQRRGAARGAPSAAGRRPPTPGATCCRHQRRCAAAAAAAAAPAAAPAPAAAEQRSSTAPPEPAAAEQQQQAQQAQQAQKAQKAQQAPQPATSGRRRRRTTSSSALSVAPRPARTVPELAQLFQAQPSAQQAAGVTRLSRGQPVQLPRGALADPRRALSGGPRGAHEAADSQPPGAVDPQLLAQFGPYANAFAVIAKQRAVPQQQQPQQQQPREQQQQRREQPVQAAAAAPPPPEQQRRRERSRRAPRDLLELFGLDDAAAGQQQPDVQVTRLQKGAPAPPMPESARAAAQQLATLLMAQQQERLLKKQQKQQQQQQPEEGESPADGTDVPDAPAAAETPAARLRARFLQTAVPQAGATRVYVPAPALGTATSAAERQPLRLLSMRQQQQMREQARRDAVRKLRERSVRDYEAALQGLLEWQASGQRTYLPGAPAHLPVAVQRTWAASHAAAAAVAAAGAGAGSEDEPPPLRQLSPEEQGVLASISLVLQQVLGQPLPERGTRGERALLLAGLAPQAVRERVGRWVGCCGAEFVAQLLSKEPSLLGQEPGELLVTLEALSQRLGLAPGECVSFALKHVAVIGLDAAALRERLVGLADAVDCSDDQAVRLATAQPALLMLTPAHVKARMQALAKLLPEATHKLPRLVARHPMLLARSPRALARNVLELSDALELSSWAASRLVAGQPSILSSNYDVLHNRLDALQRLTATSRRWQRELQALSPGALARCLVCSDAAVQRLERLAEAGVAGSGRLPPVNLLLTQPAEHFESTLAAAVAARQRAAERAASPADEEGEGAAAQQQRQQPQQDAGRSSGGDGSTLRAVQPVEPLAASAAPGTSRPAAPSRAKAATKAAAAAALARLQSSRAAPSASRSAASDSESDDEACADGLLDSDADWRASLAHALQSSAATLGTRLLGTRPGSRGGKAAAVSKEGAAAASGRRR